MMRHADRKQMTREALIASANAEIFENGISGASVRRIAERAGYTQGAFYSNFATRNALLEAVLEKHMQVRLDRMEAILLGEGPLEVIMERLGGWLKSMQDDRAGTLVMLEFQVHALRDHEFAATYNRLRAVQHASIAHAIEAIRKQYGVETKLPPMLMSLGFSALWSGFALQGRIPDDVEADDLIGAFIRALI